MRSPSRRALGLSSLLVFTAIGACGGPMGDPDATLGDGASPSSEAAVATDGAVASQDVVAPLDAAGGGRDSAMPPPPPPTDAGPPPPPVDAGPPPGCATPLASRAVVTDLSDLMPASCSSFAGISTSTVSCMRLAGAPDGSIRFAYRDRTSTVHVLSIDAAGRRGAREMTTMADDVRAVYAHEGGDVSVLVRRGIVMAIVRFGPDGAVRSDQGIVGTMGMATEGNRWAHDSIRAGALTQNGANTAMYTTVAGNWGARGIHEGDQLRNVNAMGMVQSGGWDWGCSHSLDLRIAKGPTALAPVCLSDAYPSAGIILNNRTSLVGAPGWNQGGSIGSGYASRMIIPMLGGVVPDGNGFFVSFASADGRPARDVAILRFEGTTAAPRRWLTTGAANQLAYQVDLMRLGAGMLAYWEWVAGAETSANLQELDATGAPRGAPLRMLSTDMANPLAFRGGEVPAVSVPGGDAAFVGYRSGRSGPLRLVRVRACM
jgi:hypothetical protein